MAERIPNIGPKGQRSRLMGGLVALAVGIGGTVALAILGLSRWWGLLLFVPFWQGALGVFQALNKT
jgi:hypothetical protein